MIELHTHTTYSDGQLTPQQLVAKAAAAGVKAIAITDHDTLNGWPEAIAAGEFHNLEIVPGVELSTVHNGRSLHILGYYPQAKLLAEPLAERLAGRKRRAKQIVANLAQMGYPLEFPELSDNMAWGRPHIATALVKAGYVNSCQEAFARLLGEEQPAYVHYEKFSAVEGVKLIRDCGGIPVWAHPYLFRGGRVEEVLPELLAAGLQGLEVYHPHHGSNKVKRLMELCQAHNLLVTGGTDYHGFSAPDTSKTSWQLNHFKLPLSLLDSLKAAIATPS